MVIYVSDSGIFKSDSNYPYTNTASVNKVSPIKPTDASTESVVREAEKAYVAENTPAYTISISSMGKAAVQSLKSLAQGMNNLQTLSDNNTKNTFTATQKVETNIDTESKPNIYDTAVDLNGGINISAEESSEDTVETVTETEETASSNVNTNNLARYSDYQLQQMLNDGSITRSEYNDELAKRTTASETDTSIQPQSELMQAANENPVLKQAVAAYNFQMAYQINAAITQ